MSNMSYCRFQNTLNDLTECERHWEEDLSEDEQEAQNKLLKLCEKIVEFYGQSDDKPLEPGFY